MMRAMPEPARPPRPVARRAVLLGGLAALGGPFVVAGCGIRLQNGAPHLPFVPTRAPIPDESALVALTSRCADLAAEARAAGSTALLSALAAIHDRQHEVLVTALTARDVPEAELATGAASPTAGATAAGAAHAVSVLAAAEAADLATPTALASADRALRPTLCSILAQRYAATALLSAHPPAAPTTPATPAPTTTSAPTAGTAETWPVPAELTPLLTATRSAAYGFEVVAAQTSGATRTLAEAALGVLAGLAAEQAAAAGPSAPPPALGYELPFAVSTPAQAHRLATQLVNGLRTAYGDALTALTTSAADRTFRHLPWWLGRAEVLAHTWGADLEPFPGLA